MKYEIVSIRLREALERAGISQQELSDRSGVSKASISQYVNGSHCPSNVKAGALADVLKVSPVWLMGFDVPRNPISENSEQNNANNQIINEIRKKAERMNAEQLEQLLKYARFIESEGK